MTDEVRVTPLLQLVQKMSIPTPRDGNVILARLKKSALRLPEAVQATPAKPLGKKRNVRGRKAHDHYIVMEQWAEEGQESLRVPMLLCVIDGELTLRLGAYYLTLKPGYAVLIPPGIPHPAMAHDDPPNKFCDVFFISSRGRQMHCWITEYRNGNVQLVENVTVTNTKLADDLDRIVEEMSDESVNSNAIASHLLSTIWLTLDRELRQKRFVEILPSASHEAKPAQYDPISLAKEYIQAHLHQELTLQKVARAVYLSRTQFVVLFKQETGKTFVEYLTELRLEWACQLLRETGWTVHYVCGFVGFKAPEYFHRLFRRKMGMTPMQYRQQTSSQKQND